MKKNYKFLATLVLSGLAGAAFGVLPAEAAVTVRSADGTETSLTKTEFTSLYGNTYTDSTSGNTVSISGEGTVVTLNTLAGAYTLESGDASNNKLSVTDGASVSFSNATDNWIAGGRSMEGAASGNQVTLSGVSLNLPDATTSSLEIAGGVSGASASAGASGNTVEISNTAEKEYGVFTVTGGYTKYGDANDNTVKITGTKGTDDDEIYLTSVSSDITGGETESGNADGNTVTLDTITSSGIVYGGRAGNGNDVAVTALMSVLPVSAEESTETDTSASSNSVTITGSQVEGVYGGYMEYYGDTSAEADAGVNHNTVTLTNTSASGTRVYGGYVAQHPIPTLLNYSSNTVTKADPISTSASSNSVTITGSQVEGVYGGVGQIGSAKGNTVTINDGTVKNSVLGGHSAMSDAIGNTVNIAGGIIGTESSGTGEADDNAIAGGFAKEGQANNNTVNITGGTLGAMMSLYGGYSEKGSSSNSNTLNLHTKGNTVKNLGYFQNLNFYVPEGTAAGETMVTVTENADVSKAVIQAGIEKTTKLAPGQAINLIYDAGGIKTDGTSYSMMSGKDIVSDAGFVDRKAAVKKQDDNTIVVYVPKDEKGTIHPDTKIIPEDRENGINTIKNAGDLVSNAAEGAWKEDHDVDAKFVPYAIVGGYDLHYNTGSYIDSNGMAANVGLIRRIRRDGAIDTVLPFLEYGRSNYASFLDDGARGDGRQHYTGGGVLLRRDLDDGKYYEGAIRAGRLKGDFHGIIESTALRYDSSAPYVAAQAGAGKIYAKDRDTYDLYGKFFWTHLGSDTATIRNSRGEAKYEFDDINSYRTRLGMRWTRNFDKVRSLYAGIGWDYEFDSKARAFYDAYRTDTPTVKGSSEFLELGWKSKVTSDHPWGVDLKATGWTGKQEGGTLFATVSRSF